MFGLFWLSCALSTAFASSLVPRASSFACNNSPDLCSRSYGNITHLGAHDSPFVQDPSAGFSNSVNQNYSSVAQLDAGVRLLSAQVHNDNGVWSLCHSSCSLLNVGRLSEWLTGIKSWMDRNPHDVVTIILVNSDNAGAADLHAEFQAANIVSYAYTPPSTISTLQTWPTLESLIANNTRLVTFVASLNPATNAVAPYLLDEFTFVSENPFEVTSLSGFSCQPDRPSSVKGNAQSAISSGLLPLMNHFKDVAQIFGVVVPDVWNVGITNAQSGVVGNLGDAAAQCKLVYGKAPTFILVDFFDVGPAINTVDSLNSITASGRTAPPIQSTKSASLGRGDLLSDVSSRLNSYVGLFLALWMALTLF